MNLIRRFTKPGSKRFEFFVFVDGALVQSQMFHSARVDAYRDELEVRIRQFVDAGWESDSSITEATT